jgi:alpha/beta superfamily hydrolase
MGAVKIHDFENTPTHLQTKTYNRHLGEGLCHLSGYSFGSSLSSQLIATYLAAHRLQTLAGIFQLCPFTPDLNNP